MINYDEEEREEEQKIVPKVFNWQWQIKWYLGVNSYLQLLFISLEE